MKRLVLFPALAMIGLANPAFADPFSDAVIREYQSLGFSRIEVKNGISQTKVEATRGNRTVEVVYDRASGSIIKQEWEAAEPRDRQPGIEVRDEDRDFVRVGRRGRDDDDDRRSGRRDRDDRDDDRDDDDRDDHDLRG